MSIGFTEQNTCFTFLLPKMTPKALQGILGNLQTCVLRGKCWPSVWLSSLTENRTVCFRMYYCERRACNALVYPVRTALCRFPPVSLLDCPFSWMFVLCDGVPLFHWAGSEGFLIISPSFLFLFWQSLVLVWRLTMRPQPAHLFRAPEVKWLMRWRAPPRPAILPRAARTCGSAGR